MPHLTVAVLAALISTCSHNGAANEDLLAIAWRESGADTLAIHDNGTREKRLNTSYHPDTNSDAVNVASSLLQQGHSIDLGLGQLNNHNVDRFSLSLSDAFDPCKNLESAARVLTEFSQYNTGKPDRGFTNGYVRRILATKHELLGAEPPPGAQRAAMNYAQPPQQPALTVPTVFPAPRRETRPPVIQAISTSPTIPTVFPPQKKEFTQ